MPTETETLNVIRSSESWGDMVKKIETTRRSLPWDPNSVEKIQRFPTYERKAKEREFDPVNMKWRNQEKEELLANKKKEQLDLKIKTVSDMRASKFNFISHEGPPRQRDSWNLPPASLPFGGRERHLISGLSLDGHKKCPTLYDDDYCLQNQKPKDRIQRPENRRDFDLTTNRFMKNDDDRKREEYETMKDHVVKKYWKTHNYDIIKGEFYDPNKEANFLHTRDIVSQVQGKSQLSRLPPSVLFSDGNTYNILSHEIIDQQRLNTSNELIIREMNRCKGILVQAKQQEVGQKIYDRNEERRMNRIKFNRWEKQLERGYDFIKNNNELYEPLPSRPPTVWDRVQAPTPKNNNETNDYTLLSQRGKLTNREPNSARDVTNRTSRVDNNNRTSTSNSTTRVPSLDLHHTQFGSSVSYVEPKQGPPGQPVQINAIRTGSGINSIRP